MSQAGPTEEGGNGSNSQCKWDWEPSLAAVFAIAGRSELVREQMIGDGGQSRESCAREEQERRDIRYFADAAVIMADLALDALEPWNEERRIHTRLLEQLKEDPEAVYRTWREGNPVETAAMVAAGRDHIRRLQRTLQKYIEGMAAEGHPSVE